MYKRKKNPIGTFATLGIIGGLAIAGFLVYEVSKKDDKGKKKEGTPTPTPTPTPGPSPTPLSYDPKRVRFLLGELQYPVEQNSKPVTGPEVGMFQSDWNILIRYLNSPISQSIQLPNNNNQKVRSILSSKGELVEDNRVGKNTVDALELALKVQDAVDGRNWSQIIDLVDQALAQA